VAKKSRRREPGRPVRKDHVKPAVSAELRFQPEGDTVISRWILAVILLVAGWVVLLSRDAFGIPPLTGAVMVAGLHLLAGVLLAFQAK
jgi:hypothetical protein